MKTSNYSLIKTGLVVALALAAWLPLNINAAEPMKEMKGGEHMLMLNAITTKEKLNELKTDDSIAMVCAKCKTVWVTRVQQGVKGAQILNDHGQPTELIGTHPCAACGSTMTVVGHAKGDITELKHAEAAHGRQAQQEQPTGLTNRRLLLQPLTTAPQSIGRGTHTVTTP